MKALLLQSPLLSLLLPLPLTSPSVAFALSVAVAIALATVTIAVFVVVIIALAALAITLFGTCHIVAVAIAHFVAVAIAVVAIIFLPPLLLLPSLLSPLPTPSLFDCGVEEVGDGDSRCNGCAEGNGIGGLWCRQQR